MRAYPLLCLALIATVLIASCTPKETVTTPPVTDQPVVATQPDADTTEAAPPSEPAADASELAGSDWPRFFGPNADGTSPDTGINKDWSAKPPQELWRVSLGDDGYAGPAVADGKVFIVDHQGKDDVVRAIDIATGKDAWTFPYPEPGGHNYGFTRGTPCYDNGTLYTLSMSGQLHAINAADGTKVWSKNLPQDFGGKAPNWRYASSPVVDGDRLVVLPGGQSSVAVLDKTTGDTIWAGGGPSGASYATPTIATIAWNREATEQVVFCNGECTRDTLPK